MSSYSISPRKKKSKRGRKPWKWSAEEKESMKRILVEVPEDLHTEFKLACYSNGDVMSDVLIRLIRGYTLRFRE
ncbi:MAG: plasmid partition protein ParG [Candidatus Thermoplasmatota archaeon]|nr:plasmid partition protein ParG [Candidatus Thermoplasmatota archaeon]